MDDRQSIDLAAMLCSRLCHDMLSPVGALSNGLELLAMETDPEMRANVVELLEQSATISTNKLKFFRLAFGAAGGFGERVEVAEPKALIEALVSDKPKVTINWALADATLAKPAVKVLLNFAQIAIDALVRGGSLDIGAERRDGACEIVVRAAGPKIAFDEMIGHECSLFGRRAAGRDDAGGKRAQSAVVDIHAFSPLLFLLDEASY